MKNDMTYTRPAVHDAFFNNMLERIKEVLEKLLSFGLPPQPEIEMIIMRSDIHRLLVVSKDIEIACDSLNNRFKGVPIEHYDTDSECIFRSIELTENGLRVVVVVESALTGSDKAIIYKNNEKEREG